MEEFHLRVESMLRLLRRNYFNDRSLLTSLYGPLSGRRAEESDLELSVITSQNSHYGGSDRSIGHIRENISLQKLFHNNLMVKIFGWRSSVGYQET